MGEDRGAAPRVLGRVVDEMTRCEHYRGETDIVALKFACCGAYYPCYRCHEGTADHPIVRWRERDRQSGAVLCGACRRELSIDEYLRTGACPRCAARFNPNCRLHHDIYFDFPAEAS